jgi:hypothetical protein
MESLREKGLLNIKAHDLIISPVIAKIKKMVLKVKGETDCANDYIESLKE